MKTGTWVMLVALALGFGIGLPIAKAALAKLWP